MGKPMTEAAGSVDRPLGDHRGHPKPFAQLVVGDESELRDDQSGEAGGAAVGDV